MVAYQYTPPLDCLWALVCVLLISFLLTSQLLQRVGDSWEEAPPGGSQPCLWRSSTTNLDTPPSPLHMCAPVFRSED